MFGGVTKKFTAAVCALRFVPDQRCSDRTPYVVPTQVSPMVALSIFGSQASAAALCGSAATTAAASAATAQGRSAVASFQLLMRHRQSRWPKPRRTFCLHRVLRDHADTSRPCRIAILAAIIASHPNTKVITKQPPPVAPVIVTASS